jgi:hypothetical protein
MIKQLFEENNSTSFHLQNHKNIVLMLAKYKFM